MNEEENFKQKELELLDVSTKLEEEVKSNEENDNKPNNGESIPETFWQNEKEEKITENSRIHEVSIIKLKSI